jgi:diguanylate cyclase (GGDEF)-like protein/PAS domain S-box-containing protein
VFPERVQQALDTLTEGLLIIDEHGVIQLANEAFTQLTGIPKTELIHRKADGLNWIRSREQRLSPWQRAMSERTALTDQLMLLGDSSGNQRYFLININPIVAMDREVNGVLATFRDVTETETRRVELERSLAMMRTYRDQVSRQNAELLQLASHDPLTGCLNRRAFFDELQRIVVLCDESQQPISCLMIDGDFFKQINDCYGHEIGDKVLRYLGTTLTESTKEHGLACRYGGEEFCVVLPNLDQHAAWTWGEELRKKIELFAIPDAPELKLTVSVGVAQRVDLAMANSHWINQADQALYLAKSRGRNQVLIFDPSTIKPDSATGTRSHSASSEDTTSESDGHRILPFEAVTALVSVLANRDRATAEHSRRVAELCIRASSGLLDYRTTYILETAAMLHDIGKIAVPDQILFKPGPLTRDEWKVIRQHDRLGAEIIAGTFNCDELNQLIRWFQLPYGYRNHEGLSSAHGNYPLAARLLAIADSYDAMRSDRPYRKGRTHDECVAELRRYADIQFDRELVEHFASIICQADSLEQNATAEVTRQSALKIGLQIEHLVRAIDSKDTEGLRLLATRLATMGRQYGIETISTAADRLRSAADDEDAQWLRLLENTHSLLGLCRATQRVFLEELVDADSRNQTTPVR